MVRMLCAPNGADPMLLKDVSAQAVVPEGALEAALEEDPARPGYLDSGFRLVLAVNKADLLPSVVTRTRLEVLFLASPM